MADWQPLPDQLRSTHLYNAQYQLHAPFQTDFRYGPINFQGRHSTLPQWLYHLPYRALNPSQKNCLLVLALGSDNCEQEAEDIIETAAVQNALITTDLIELGREATKRFGRDASLALMTLILRSLDDSNGRFEQTMIKHSADSNARLNHSLLSVADSQKHTLCLFFVLGYKHDARGFDTLADDFEHYFAKQNIYARHLVTHPNASTESNARRIKDQFIKLTENHEHCVVVSLSKGSQEVQFMVQHLAEALPQKTREIGRAVV